MYREDEYAEYHPDYDVYGATGVDYLPEYGIL
jgi:hypothetical protein